MDETITLDLDELQKVLTDALLVIQDPNATEEKRERVGHLIQGVLGHISSSTNGLLVSKGQQALDIKTLRAPPIT